MHPVTVLIADDHQFMYTAWRLFLDKDPGFTVVGTATNGEQAISLARIHKPDVVLLDVKMPVMDGLEATRALLAMLPQSKVLGVSASTQPQQVRHFLEIGAAGYISKYARATELKEAILAIIQGKRWICNHVRERFLSELPDPCEQMMGLAQLSIREVEVANLVQQGHTSAGIAAILGVSVRTVEAHRTSIFKKLGVKNRTQLSSMLQEEVRPFRATVHF